MLSYISYIIEYNHKYPNLLISRFRNTKNIKKMQDYLVWKNESLSIFTKFLTNPEPTSQAHFFFFIAFAINSPHLISYKSVCKCFHS